MALTAILGHLLLAQGMAPIPSDSEETKSVQILSMDLSAGNYGERRFAGRELRRKARVATRHVHRASPDSIESLEARKTLGELRRHALPACMTQLTEPATAVFCAQILTSLEDPSALPTVQAALDSPGLPLRARRALRKTQATLQELP